MKTIGLLGGMSWESTAVYYQLINQDTRRRLGGLHSAPLVMWSVDFHRIEHLQTTEQWDQAGELLAGYARCTEQAGAECLVLCTNTMHKVADQIVQALEIPMIHIADATAARLQSAGCARVGLLGTQFTMEDRFYVDKLEHFGMEVVLPNAADRRLVHRVIYDELCMGDIRAASRRDFLSIIAKLKQDGAEAIIAGCTEIAMLVDSDSSEVPIFDTTRIHAGAAVEYALGGKT